MAVVAVEPLSHFGVQDEADAYKLFEDLRWAGTPVCPHCRSGRVFYLTPENGVTRKTTRGTASPRRVWKCGGCRQQFSVLTGTVFHGTHVPLRTWLQVISDACSPDGVSAVDVRHRYGLAWKSAHLAVDRLRAAAEREPVVGLLEETVGRTLPVDDVRHGTWNGYANLGCRCDRCRAAARVYMYRRRHRTRMGDVLALIEEDLLAARVHVADLEQICFLIKKLYGAGEAV